MVTEKNELIYEGQTYCFVPIEVTISNSELVEYPIYLPLFENRLVKVNYGTEKLKEVLPRYQAKGVSSILLEKEHYELFLGAVQEKMSRKIRAEKTFSGKIKVAQDEFEVLKKNILEVGLSPYAIERAEAIASEVLEGIKQEKDIREMMGNFKKMCKEEFQKNISISFVAYAMLKTFSWCDDPIIKNVITGILICDVTLTQEDFEELRKQNMKTLSKKVKNHPIDVAKVLEKSKAMMSPDTIKVIEEHHENPEGNGFPRGMNADQVSFIGSIHIIAREFVETFSEHDFNLADKLMILNEIHQRFFKGNYRRACTALFDVLDMPNPVAS